MKTLRTFTLSILAAMLVSIPAFGQARLQVIHNSPDAAAATVDVWLNGTLLIDNFEFRTATSFIDAPAGVPLNIEVKGSESTAQTPAVASFEFILEESATYIAIASGLVSPAGYQPYVPFNIDVYAMGRESSADPQQTDLLVYHGSTDAPVVDIHEVGVPAGQLVDDLNYASFGGYLELPVNDYSIQVRDRFGSTVAAQYLAPLAQLGTEGQALTVVASGFLNPLENNRGPAFGLWVATANGGPMIPLPQEDISTARAQIIHNSADNAARVVDIYINDALFLDDFAFRTATPFVDVPATVTLSIDVLPSNSTSPDNPVATFDVAFTGGKAYQVIANGLVNTQDYSPFQPFNLYVYDMAREGASVMGNTDVMVFHGATDAPVVDVFEVGAGAGQIVDNLGYTDFQGYLELPQADYTLQLRDESGTETIAQYAAPVLTLGLEDQALTILASGFLNPAVNANGPAFGLYVALPTGGDLIPLPQESISTARVQVIHNSADPAAAVVDVWLNQTLLIDNFAFRTATPFVDAPAGEIIQISILPSNSTSPENPIARFPLSLEAGEKYIVVANGEIGRESNDGTSFNLFAYAAAREMAQNPANTDLLIFHGSTDAPAVDLFEVSGMPARIWDDLTYSDFTGYLSLPVNDYSLQVRDASGMNVVAQYAVPLALYGADGQALTVVASGYLAPAAGEFPAFGLYVALPTGGPLVALPQEDISTARIQVIHNSADAVAEMVDVYLDGTLIVDDFAFRTATPYVDVPANRDIVVDIYPANSDENEQSAPVASFTYNLEGNERYILVANGIVSPSGYEPNRPFDIYVYGGAREMALESNNTDVVVFHGSTDAPVVDVYEIGAGAGQIINDLTYGDFAGYLGLPTSNYTLQIRDERGEEEVATYFAPLSGFGLDGASLTIVASGFLNPAANNDGPSFGLWVALAGGGALIELPLMITTSVEEEIISEESFTLYPNPARSDLNVQFVSVASQNAQVDIYDLVGNKVYSSVEETQRDGVNTYTFDVSNFNSGMYIIRITSGNEQITEKFKIFR